MSRKPSIDALDIEKVESTIGFELSAFFNEVNAIVDNDIEKGMIAFKHDLITFAKTRGLKITEDDMSKACEHLHRIIKHQFHRNLELFELYSYRNIFTVPPAPASRDRKESTAALATIQSQLDNITNEVESLRTKYLEVYSEHTRLLNECSDNDLLLKDMRSALFHLRVGSQVLDEYDVQPLDDTIKSILEGKQALANLSSRAMTLNNDIRSRLNLDTQPKIPQGKRSRSGRSLEIETRGAQDLKELSAALDHDS